MIVVVGRLRRDIMTELPKVTEDEMRTVVLHYHLFKNAGTSLDKVLQENFGEKWVTREFPRRSNPVVHVREVAEWIMGNPEAVAFSSHTAELPPPVLPGIRVIPLIFIRHPIDRIASRSEEHTSELQSLMRISYAGFCLKKKNQTKLE